MRHGFRTNLGPAGRAVRGKGTAACPPGQRRLVRNRRSQGICGEGDCLCQMKKGGQFGSERVYLMTRKRLVVPQRRCEGACNRAAGANGTFCGKGGMERSPFRCGIGGQFRSAGTRARILGKRKGPERDLAPGPCMVPLTGVEPVRYHYLGILSPVCLPISPQRHTTLIIIQ